MHAMEEEFKHEQAKATNKFNTTLQELKEKNTEVFLLSMIFADCVKEIIHLRTDLDTKIETLQEAFDQAKKDYQAVNPLLTEFKKESETDQA